MTDTSKPAPVADDLVERLRERDRGLFESDIGIKSLDVELAERLNAFHTARENHVAAVAAYNARLMLVRAERARDNWGAHCDIEYQAMNTAQRIWIEAGQRLADEGTAKEAAARITADAAVIAAMKAGEDPTMWDFWNKKARELAEKNTALRAVIAGKDAEIERLTRSYDTCLKCYEGAIHRYEQAETAEARITDLQAALIIARDRFASYRDQHQAKGTDDGHAKALRNAEMVEMIDHALAGKATADAGERDAQG